MFSFQYPYSFPGLCQMVTIIVRAKPCIISNCCKYCKHWSTPVRCWVLFLPTGSVKVEGIQLWTVCRARCQSVFQALQSFSLMHNYVFQLSGDILFVKTTQDWETALAVQQILSIWAAVLPLILAVKSTGELNPLLSVIYRSHFPHNKIWKEQACHHDSAGTWGTCHFLKMSTCRLISPPTSLVISVFSKKVRLDLFAVCPGLLSCFYGLLRSTQNTSDCRQTCKCLAFQN